MSDGVQLSAVSAPLTLGLAEELTRQFYSWERRGRGWQVWEHPVELEPPFRPCIYYLPQTYPDPEAGREPTWLSRLAQFWSGGSTKSTAGMPTLPPEPALLEPEPTYVEEGTLITEFELALPPTVDVPKAASEHLILNLSYCVGPIAFEVVGTTEKISIQYACQERDAAQLYQQVSAHIPEGVVQETSQSLGERWSARQSYESVVVDFGLSHEFVRPLRTFRNFTADPLTGVVAAMSQLQDDEVSVLQMLFSPVRERWAENIFYAVTDFDGGSFFVDAPEMVSLAREKISLPLYSVVIRVAARSRFHERTWDIVRGLGSALAQYGNPSTNELIPLTNDAYPDYLHEQDLLNRLTRRSGMILNSDELVCLAHPPSPSVQTEKLNRLVLRTKSAPAVAQGHPLLLGENTHNGQTAEVSLNDDQRTKHLYCVGASGTGKSTFLLNLIIQDIEAGRGLAVLDPHGDLIDEALARIPENRQKDVVLFDPSDEEFPIGFNILSAHSELEKNLIASDLVAMFRRLSTSWGDQMTSVFGNAILAMLESSQGGTLADLRRFLVEKSFRAQFLKTVSDRELVYYWEKEFPMLSGRPQGPILTRLDAFLRPKLIRYMVAQKENKLDFADIMNSGKIFLAKLSQGAIGEENSYLLGALLVSKFHQITLSRQEIQAAQRRPFFLYIDEFHNFVTPSMAAILSGVRKYRLGLILAHQELRQLEARDREVASAVLSNPYTRVCFRVGDADARKLAEGFRYFEARDLQDLSTGQAIVRIERADYDFNLNTSMPSAIDDSVRDERYEVIRAESRSQYGTPRQEVEAALEEQWDRYATSEPPAPKPAKSAKRKAAEKDDSGPVAPTRKDPKPAQVEATKTQEQEPSAKTSAATERPETKATRQAKPKRDVSAPPLMGKGGQEHTYLQNLIKRWAEGMGYRATIEKQLNDGESVDVALEKGDFSVACEVTVTTTPSHEVGNLKKCLASGFQYVVSISTDPKKLNEVRALSAEELSSNELERVRFMSPDELFRFIEEIEAQAASREKTVRGYKVKVKYGAPGDQEKKARKRAVSQVILGALSKSAKKKS